MKNGVDKLLNNVKFKFKLIIAIFVIRIMLY